MKKSLYLLVLLVLLVSACAPANTAPPPQQVTEPAAETAPAEAVTQETTAPAETKAPAETEAPAEAAPVAGGTLTRALTSEPPSLDPHGAAGAGQNAVLPYLVDTLVYRDLDNSYQPYLAETWEVSPDGRTFTFNLREGVTFHDGTPLNAEAVRFTFQRVKDEGTRSPLTGAFANIESIEAVSDTQVVITLRRPSATFLSSLSTAYAGIISPTAVAEAGDQFGMKPVGSGPFQMESWQAGEAITLVRNEAYAWPPAVSANTGAPYLEKLVFKILPDASTQLLTFQTGEVDVLFVNQPAQLTALQNDPNAELVETTLNSLVFLGFNMQAEPVSDERVRRAIAHAVNKDELVELVLGGVGITAFSPLAPTMPGHDPALKSLEPAFDLSQSAALLEEAGYTRQDDGTWLSADGQPLTLELMTTTRPPNEALATVLQAQLKAAGIMVEILPLESSAAIEAATRGEYQMMLWRYDWNDPDVLNVYLSSARIGETNRNFYNNPELDDVIGQAAAEMNADARNALYSQAQAILIEDQVWIPLYIPKDYIVMRTTVKDMIQGPMGRIILTDAWLQP